MFITALVFMSGIMAYFNDCAMQASVFVSVAALFILFRKYISYKYILFWIFIFYLGFFNSYFRVKSTDALSEFAPADVSISGRILSIPNSNSDDKIKFFFGVDSLNENPVEGKTLVTLTAEDGRFENFNIGDRYSIKGKLRQPFMAANPSQFDYAKYLRNYKTYTTFYAEKDDCTAIDNQLSFKWKFLQGLNDVRNRILNTHAKYLKSPNIEILGGIVFGDDAVAPPDYIKTTFVNSGLLHILAASGMNVAFVYGFWFFILRRLRVPFKITVVSGMVVIVLYTLMTGLGPSLIRAALMLLFILAGKLIDRDAHSVALLALVAMLMLIYNPAYINDVGFQLSFLVTFGLLTTANAVSERLDATKIPSWISAGILIPIVAQIWVAPIQMFYFNTFSTYSILANIATMPFLSIISFGGFVSSVLAVIQPVSDFVCMVSDFILKYFLDILVWISTFFSHLPYASITTTHPSVFQILIYYLIVLLITYSFKTEFTKKIFVAAGVLMLFLFCSMITIPSKEVEIITFDVQNADAFLVKSPQNKYFIIDTGKSGYRGSNSQAKIIILKYLKDRGIKNIEGLIITHFDNDHSGGAVDLMENLKIRNVYLNTYDSKAVTSVKIYNTLKSERIPSNIAKNNDLIYKEDDFTLRTFKAECENDNENSIITLLSYKDFDMIFTGDAGIEAFNKVKSNVPHNIEIFKVGHHGAGNVVDGAMLAHLSPDISVISTGRNSFGHPRKGTLDILRNTRTYRTDINHSVKITSNGEKYNVYTYSRDKHKYIQDFSKNIRGLQP